MLLFFCPAGSNVLLKGELEKFQGKKGLPDPVELFDTILDEGGRIILCELALEAKDIKKEDLRDDRIEILNAPSFLMDARLLKARTARIRRECFMQSTSERRL